tara:strand:- start:578 stop:1573 length:996 start_codon:yes stop_codon:yes gene_type:complete
MHSLQIYSQNKLFSFIGVFACIFFTLAIFGFGKTQWQAILLAILIFGYGHFILGFYYQLKGFSRLQKPWQSYLTFIFLAAFSVVLAVGVSEYFGFTAALFVGFVYFLLHGLLNEQTLILRQTGIFVPLLFLTALAIFIMSLLTYSVPDQTFFFNERLQFQEINEFWVGYAFETQYMSLSNFESIFWYGSVFSFGLLLLAWRSYGFGKLTAFLAIMMGLITYLVYTYGPPAYIYMYLFVVGYHFMTWLLFYLVEMKRRGIRVYRLFVIQNLVIIVPLLLAAFLFFRPRTPEWVYYVFDYRLFIVMTYIHISTSFMNDQWLQSLQARIFRFLG